MKYGMLPPIQLPRWRAVNDSREPAIMRQASLRMSSFASWIVASMVRSLVEDAPDVRLKGSFVFRKEAMCFSNGLLQSRGGTVGLQFCPQAEEQH
jgi:hypothetical protein